jgi:proteic killer suppression protein
LALQTPKPNGFSRKAFARLNGAPCRKSSRESWTCYAAPSLDTLRSPPGNRLEALKADRAGQFSIRVNDRWRVCFVWTEAAPDRVEIVDYH